MTSTAIETKLKARFEEQSRKNDIYENSIALLNSIVQTQKSEIDELKAKKDNIDKVKESHKQFGDSFNTTVKSLDDKMKTSDSLYTEKLKQVSERMDSLKADIGARCSHIETDVASLKTALDF